MVYYTSAKPVHFKDIIDTEVNERGNYTHEQVDHWKKKYRIDDHDKAVWVSPKKWVANKYNLPAEQHDEAHKIPEKDMDVMVIDSSKGYIIKESDDGDEGYIFVFKREIMATEPDRLQELLKTMNVPELRKKDYGWLLRNLPIQNKNHPDITEAMELIKKNIKTANETNLIDQPTAEPSKSPYAEAYRVVSLCLSSAYPGNLGIEEMFKFWNKAKSEDKNKMIEALKNQKYKEVIQLLRDVIEPKLYPVQGIEPGMVKSALVKAINDISGHLGTYSALVTKVRERLGIDKILFPESDEEAKSILIKNVPKLESFSSDFTNRFQSKCCMFHGRPEDVERIKAAWEHKISKNNEKGIKDVISKIIGACIYLGIQSINIPLAMGDLPKTLEKLKEQVQAFEK